MKLTNVEILKTMRDKSDITDGDAGMSERKDATDKRAVDERAQAAFGRHEIDYVETERLREAYADVQRRYDLLEESILYNQRQKFEAQVADRESKSSKLFEAKEVNEKLRERLKEERARNREILDDLRNKLKEFKSISSDNLGGGRGSRIGSANISKKDHDILKARLSAVQNDIKVIRRSWSWRITAPLRFLKRLFKT